MLVSIIMPTYNRGYIISTAIESIIYQNYSNWELLIVDDGSADETESIVLKYNYDSRIKYFKLKENRGANYCRNYGANNAKGEFLAFIDSDVIWKSDKLRKQVEAITENHDCEFVFCKTMIIRKERKQEFPDCVEEIVRNPERIKYGNYIDTNTVLIKKKAVIDNGGFDENLPRLQEWELFIRLILKEKYKFHFMNEHLCDNYIQVDSITENFSKYVIAMNYIIGKHSDIFGCGNFKEYIDKRINLDLTEFISENEKVYIYGAGYYGKFLKDYIKDRFDKTAYFVVTNYVSGCDVVEITRLKKDDPIIIGVGSRLNKEIKNILISNGYSNWIDGYCWN